VKLVQRQDASDNILLVMISAIFSLLSVRLYLTLAHFPRIGSGSWHVAHAVTGGTLMILSTLLSISFYGKKIRKIYLIIFGLGIGLFIDEIGKFISTGNDYLFQPALSFIYVFFIIIFLLYWYLSKDRSISSKKHLYRAIDKFEEAIESDLQTSEKLDIINNLNSAIKSNDPPQVFLAKHLKTIIQSIDDLEDKRTKRIKLFWQKTRSLVYRLFKKKLSLTILIVVSFIYSLISVVDFVYLFSDQSVITSNLFWIKTFSDLFVSILFLSAIFIRLAKKTGLSLRLFQYGLLINIFLSQIFKFYFEQFQALIGLSISIIIFFGLKRLRQEKVI